MAGSRFDQLMEALGLKDAEQEEPRDELESFRRPDGSVDMATVTNPRLSRMAEMERGLPHTQTAGPMHRRTADRPVPQRFDFSEVPTTDVRGLGEGSSSEPVPEDEALANLGAMKRKPVLNSNGIDISGYLEEQKRKLAEPVNSIAKLGEDDADLARSSGAILETDQLNQPFPDRQDQPEEDPRWAGIRKQADDAVGAMNADAEQHDREAARDAVQRFQASRGRASPRLETGGAASPTPERPAFKESFTELAAKGEPGPASPRQPLMAAQQLGMGAAPPDTSAAEAELKDAQRSRDEELLAAQIASQFGRYADIQGGTQSADAGAGVRAGAGRALEDLKAKRGLRQSALERQQADEDRAFEREGVELQRGDAARKRTNEIEYNDGRSAISKRRRSLAVAQYPQLVARISPAEWNTMSAADVDALLKEAAPVKPAGGHGGGGSGVGMKPGELNSLRKQLPPHLVDTYTQLQNAYAEIEGMGGWGNVKAGPVGSMTPTMLLDPANQRVRQTIGRVVSAFLQSGGGKSITEGEKKILTGMINADPTSFATKPEMLQLGLNIIERSMANAARQGLAGAPQGAKDALLGDMGIAPEWVQGGDLPRKPGAPAPAEEMIPVRNKQTGKTGKMPRSRFNPEKYEMVSP